MASNPPALLDLPPSPIPAVLLGGVTLVRCLGLAGIPAVIASPDPSEPAFASRHCRAASVIPPYDHPKAVNRLLAIGERLRTLARRRVPLLCGSDDALQFIYAHRDRLQRHFAVLLNEPAIASALIDKDRFQALAAERGLPVPRELRWESKGPDGLATAAGPIIVKPRSKVDFHDSQLDKRVFGGDAKALVLATGAEAMDDPALAIFREQLTFQEFIPGDDGSLWSYHGFSDEKGEVLAAFVGRKIRTDPPVTGESAFIEMAEEPSLASLGREIAGRLRLRGPFKMDFKRDARDGRWWLLEINARHNLWHYLAARNGLNLVRVAYDYVLDRKRPAEASVRMRYRWLSLEGDWRAYRALHARGELSTARWLASIAASRNVYNLFAWDDPGPWLRFWRLRLARRMNRGSERFVAMVRQWRSTAS
jgi:predicted ATP-grasp superfamily ATP-dependent carboligase